MIYILLFKTIFSIIMVNTILIIHNIVSTDVKVSKM